MRSVRTTFQILEAVADSQPIGLSELARRLELRQEHRATQPGDPRRPRLDPPGRARTHALDARRAGADPEQQVDDLRWIASTALPVLAQLNSETLETIHLAVLEARTVRLIERLDSERPLPAGPGDRHPLPAACLLNRKIRTRAPARSRNRRLYQRRPDARHRQHHHRPRQASRRTQGHPRTRIRDRRRGTHRRHDLGRSLHTVSTRGRPIAAMSVSGPSIRMREHRHAYGQRAAIAAAEVEANLHGASR